jgi:hypothetical protein
MYFAAFSFKLQITIIASKQQALFLTDSALQAP